MGGGGLSVPRALWSQGRELGDSPCPEHISGKALRTGGPPGSSGDGSYLAWGSE